MPASGYINLRQINYILFEDLFPYLNTYIDIW